MSEQKNLNYGIVISKWYQEEYMDQLLEKALKQFKVKEKNISQIFWVPGSYEIPFGAQKLFENDIQAILTLGVIIRGDTSHYDHVAGACVNGIMQVSLKFNRPVIMGVLTCDNHDQVKKRLTKITGWVNDLIYLAEGR